MSSTFYFFINIVSLRLALGLFINIHEFLLLSSCKDFSALPHWSKYIFWFTWNRLMNLEAMSFILHKNIVRSCSETPSLVTNISKEVLYYLVWILIPYGFQASCESSCDKVSFQLCGVREIEVLFIQQNEAHCKRFACLYGLLQVSIFILSNCHLLSCESTIC